MNSISFSRANFSPSSVSTSRLSVSKKTLLFLHIALVPDEDEAHVLVAVGLGLLEPLLDVLEGLSSGDVVDDDRAGRGLVIRSGDRLEVLLSGLRNNERKEAVPCPRFIALSFGRPGV
jgi:hypothetical protein